MVKMVIMKKTISIIFIIFSLIIIGYGICFILDYYLVIKYSIEDCLPLGGKGTFPVVSDRLDEIHALVNYAEIVVIYAIYALSLAVYWLLNINKK